MLEFNVYGPNTSDGTLHLWAFHDEKYAHHFAKQLATDTGAEVLVLQKLGVWRPERPPVEYVPVVQESPHGK